MSRGPASLLPLDGGALAHVISHRLAPPRAGREGEEPCGLQAEAAAGVPLLGLQQGSPWVPAAVSKGRSLGTPRPASDGTRCGLSWSFVTHRSFPGHPSSPPPLFQT